MSMMCVDLYNWSSYGPYVRAPLHVSETMKNAYMLTLDTMTLVLNYIDISAREVYS